MFGSLRSLHWDEVCRMLGCRHHMDVIQVGKGGLDKPLLFCCQIQVLDLWLEVLGDSRLGCQVGRCPCVENSGE